jgi:hypothetical protein
MPEATRRTFLARAAGVAGLASLGVEHTQTPAFMRPDMELRTPSGVDAVNRTNPWEQHTLQVYTDNSAVPQPLEEMVSTQIGHALEYYNDGGEGATPDGVELVTTDRRSDADVVIKTMPKSDIDGRHDAYAEYHGRNPDDDRPIERIYHGTIYVAYDVERETGYIGYVTGYYIGFLLTLESAPAPPWADDEITYRDRWWERAGERSGVVGDDATDRSFLS